MKRSFFQLLLHTLARTLLYFFMVGLLYTLGVLIGIFTVPNDVNIINWDASWYREVMSQGYLENNDQGRYASCAFYPLFPLVWRALHVGGLGISVLNGFVFCISISLVFYYFKITWLKSFLFLSTPVLVFCFLPYTEASCFLFLTLFMLAFFQNSPLVACSSLFLAGLCRPMLWQAVPMLAVWMVLDFKRLKKSYFSFPFLLLCTSLASFLALNVYQYMETGVWNANVKAYAYWGGKLQMPTLPLRTFQTSLSGIWIKQLDYLAFSFSLLSMFYLLFFLYKTTLRRKHIGKNQLFFAMSCAYFFSIMLIRLFTMKGDLWSLSRYVFVNPFFAYFLFFSLRLHFSKLSFFFSIAYLFVSQRLFTLQGWGSGWTNFLWADLQFLATGSSFSYVGSFNKKWLYLFLIVLGMGIQCFLLHCFLLRGEWVG